MAGDKPITVAGKSTVTTNDAGAAEFNGIHLGNVVPVNGADTYQDLWSGQGTQFCLLETKAPKGYAAQPKPIAVNLTAAADTSQPVTAQADVKNTKANAGAVLPLTGGMGIYAILAAGLALIIAGLGYLAWQRRSEQNAK